MSCEHLIVDSLSASATVIYDLDSSSATFMASEIETQPPRRRRSWSSSHLADGATLAAESFENREITVTMRPKPGATAQEQAADLLVLQRLFSAGRYWLKHRPEGVASPVFYRLFPADLDLLNYYQTATPDRDVTFTVPADPFGYGLPESGTATIVNDPTVTDGMRFTISNVKGDVPTPLLLQAANSDVGSSSLWASSTDATLRNATIGFTVDALEPGNDWARTTIVDSTAIGGSHLRVTASTSAGWGLATFPAMPAGEYRVVVRAKSNSPAKIAAAPWASLATGFQASPPVEISTSGWKWHDLGVVRLPTRARRRGKFSGGLVADGILALNVTRTSGTPQVDLDHVVLVPAPGADRASGRLLLISGPAVVSQYVVDGPDGAVYGSGSGGSIGWSISAAGGFPEVAPAATNLVVNLPTLTPFSMPDKKAATASVNWSYYPRYLTLRGD